MITRKAFIAQLRQMDPALVLFPAWKRNAHHRGGAAEEALKQFFPNTTLGQSSHCTGNGKRQENPKWLAQLYTDLAWDTNDITPGWILYHLNWKPSQKRTTKAQRIAETTARLDELNAQEQAEMAADEAVEACAMMEPEKQEQAPQRQMNGQWRLSIDMLKVQSRDDMQAIIAALKPDLDSSFVGLRYLFARYNDKDIAYARALDVECTAPCGRVEIEEVSA